MVEYQPLFLPETVRVKLDHWLYPAKDQAEILNKYWDRILFELIQDVGCSGGSQRWRSEEKNYPSAWMKHKSITYEVRKGELAGSETHTLFRVKNGIAREVPSSKTKLRQVMLSALSADAHVNTPSKS